MQLPHILHNVFHGTVNTGEIVFNAISLDWQEFYMLPIQGNA
jgi:hypothetical protein